MVHSIEITAPITQAETPTAQLNFTLSDPPDEYYLVARYTTTGIASLDQNLPDLQHPGFYVTMKPAYSLHPGVYNDTIRVRLCKDSECNDALSSEQSFPVTYTVSEPTGAEAPQVHVSTNAIAFNQPLNGSSTLFPRPPPVEVTYVNFPAFPTATISVTHLGLDSATYVPTGDGSTGHIDIYLSVPSLTGPGVFHDTITLNACLDTECNNAMTPQVIDIEYTVTNTVDGPQGYRINSYAINARDLIYDATHDKLIVAVNADAGDHPSTLATLNPLTGELSEYVSLAAEEPNILALSDDGQFLYVGFAHTNIVQRLTLPDLTSDITISLPDYLPSSPSSTLALKVAPGAPHTIAVAIKDDSGNPYGMLVYDDATPRPQTFGLGGNQSPAYRPAYLEWGADATTLYACASSINYIGAPMLELAVDAMGLTLTGEPLMTAGTPMHFLNGLVYEDYGAIFDPATHALAAQTIGTVDENRAMALDAANNKVFMATAGPQRMTRMVWRSSPTTSRHSLPSRAWRCLGSTRRCRRWSAGARMDSRCWIGVGSTSS
jgi:hypothetical protein